MGYLSNNRRAYPKRQISYQSWAHPWAPGQELAAKLSRPHNSTSHHPWEADTVLVVHCTECYFRRCRTRQ